MSIASTNSLPAPRTRPSICAMVMRRLALKCRNSAAIEASPVSLAASARYLLISEPLFPVLEELGIGFVAYSPLARGFLSGTVKSREHYDVNDFRQRIPWWNPENFDQNLSIVSELTTLADSKGVTLSQLALAWLLAKKDYIVPIPGSRNPERVAQNVAAADLKLTADDLARIDEIAPEGGIGGRGRPRGLQTATARLGRVSTRRGGGSRSRSRRSRCVPWARGQAADRSPS
jgi:hypothetical protein